MGRADWPHGPLTTARRGQYAWQSALPADQQLPWQGLAPTLIQWLGAAHPTQALPPSAVTLARLELLHPQATGLAAALQALHFDGTQPPVSVSQTAAAPKLRATFHGPLGTVAFEAAR